MNYYGGKELAASFRTVRKNTLAVAQDIPADKYSYRSVPGVRSVAELLIHIANGTNFAEQFHGKDRGTTLQGFDFGALIQKSQTEEKTPRTKEQIIELLTANGDRFAAWLEGLDDNFLGEPVKMPDGAAPAAKSRFEMILGVKEHEMHSRAQLMLIERQLGIVPHLTREREAHFAGRAAQQQPAATAR